METILVNSYFWIGFYIIGVILNIYLFVYKPKDSSLDEDSGLIETLFIGFFELPFLAFEAMFYLLISFGSWITLISLSIYFLYKRYFTDEGRYQKQRNIYIHQIYKALKEWSKYFKYKEVKIENGHINIYYEDDYYPLSIKNEKYINKHIRRAIDNFPTLICNYTIKHLSVKGKCGYKTRIDLNYSLKDYIDWKNECKKIPGNNGILASGSW